MFECHKLYEEQIVCPNFSNSETLMDKHQKNHQLGHASHWGLFKVFTLLGFNELNLSKAVSLRMREWIKTYQLAFLSCSQQECKNVVSTHSVIRV